MKGLPKRASLSLLAALPIALGVFGADAIRSTEEGPRDSVEATSPVDVSSPREAKPQNSAPEPASSSPAVHGDPLLARLPLAFVENHGQWDEPAMFIARRGGVVARLERDAIALKLEVRDEEGSVRGVVLRQVFEGAREDVALEGEEHLPGLYHFFLGADPAKWVSDVHGYGSVLYRGLYEGIDLRVRAGEGRILEYDLLAAPGADLGKAVIRCEGGKDLRIEEDGSLVIGTALGEVRLLRPETWQERSSGERVALECRYRLFGNNRFGFEVPDRDAELALIVDPGIVFSTFLGGMMFDAATTLALDSTGTPTVAGTTNSLDFPTSAGAYDTTMNTGDAFVTRLSSSGSSLLYSTFLGGTSPEHAYALALDSTGAATVAGETGSSNFPTTAGAYDTTFNAGGAFIARLSSSGSSLLYSTFLGGMWGELISAVGLDSTGAATVAGFTLSSDFPTTAGAYDTTFNSVPFSVDAFVTRLSPSGSSLLYSTFLGGTGSDGAHAVAVDSTGAATVAGETLSGNFPTTPGAYDRTFSGGVDAFVTRLSASGSSLLYSTFLGGSSSDWADVLALDSTGAATVAGATYSSDFPTTAGAYDTTFNSVFGTAADVFVTRLSSSGNTVLFSTFLGGTATDEGFALALNSTGAATVAGSTGSPNHPTTAGAYDTSYNGGTTDAFIARLSPSWDALLYSTFFGGTTFDNAYALALDSTGAATVAGSTSSPNFPTTAGAQDTTFNGGPFFPDAFVTRLDLLPEGASTYGASTPGCAGPLAIGVTSIPQVGNANFAITCTNAPPNTAGLLGVSLASASPIFFLAGVLVALDPLTVFFLDASSNSLGASEVPIPIPNSPLLVGGQAFAQFLWFGPSSPSPPCPPTGLSASNALAITLQP